MRDIKQVCLLLAKLDKVASQVALHLRLAPSNALLALVELELPRLELELLVLELLGLLGELRVQLERSSICVGSRACLSCDRFEAEEGGGGVPAWSHRLPPPHAAAASEPAALRDSLELYRPCAESLINGSF